MSRVQKHDLSKILREYLSQIVYIDDTFEVTWNLEKEENPKKPSKSNRYIGKSIENSDAKPAKPEKSKFETFCEFVQITYPEILLTPILYSSRTKDDQLLLHMKNARLLILDWSLASKTTAVKLLNEADFSGQLRFCVIYTSKLVEAKAEFINEMKGVKKQGLLPGKWDKENYEYIRADSTIYMICEKDKFDFDMIIKALTDVFVKEIGYFPIAFIDMIAGLEQKVPYYLNKFAQPFDKLLLLQTNADELPLEDMYHTVSDMVINNIRSDIDLDEQVLKSIYSKQVESLETLIETEDLFNERLVRTLDITLGKLECDDKVKSAIKKISNENYKKIVNKVIKKQDNLYKGIEEAGRFMAKCCADHMAEEMLQGFVGDEQHQNKIKKELSGMYKIQFEKKIKKVLPACLITLLNPEQDYEINNLITSLKTISYEEEEQRFNKIFYDCYNEKDDTMVLKCNTQDHPQFILLQNKLKTGDILFEKEDIDEKSTAYLCIVPSCHMLRPKKVDGKILFLKGRIVKDYPTQTLKDNQHFTILPEVNEKGLVHVIWQYHDVVSIDMSIIKKEEFFSYYRPYRLAYEYTRQIVGEFVSFYSKSGVEDLFFKSDISLHQLMTKKVKASE
ncbi:MAG: response regulator receiver domain [Lachnospiraceae bacterium]|nr:response regulator receiver domain [Lachnospiraceae bacterium]